MSTPPLSTPLPAGQPAIERLLMLAAGPCDDPHIALIGDQLAVFADVEQITALASVVAVRTAERLVDGASLAITDAADLVAFGMIAHAGDHGHEGLAWHLEGLGHGGRTAIAIGLLSMWRQVCSADAAYALATVRIPRTLPEGIA